MCQFCSDLFQFSLSLQAKKLSQQCLQVKFSVGRNVVGRYYLSNGMIKTGEKNLFCWFIFHTLIELWVHVLLEWEGFPGDSTAPRCRSSPISPSASAVVSGWQQDFILQKARSCHCVTMAQGFSSPPLLNLYLDSQSLDILEDSVWRTLQQCM